MSDSVRGVACIEEFEWMPSDETGRSSRLIEAFFRKGSTDLDVLYNIDIYKDIHTANKVIHRYVVLCAYVAMQVPLTGIKHLPWYAVTHA